MKTTDAAVGHLGVLGEMAMDGEPDWYVSRAEPCAGSSSPPAWVNVSGGLRLPFADGVRHAASRRVHLSVERVRAARPVRRRSAGMPGDRHGRGSWLPRLDATVPDRFSGHE